MLLAIEARYLLKKRKLLYYPSIQWHGELMFHGHMISETPGIHFSPLSLVDDSLPSFTPNKPDWPIEFSLTHQNRCPLYCWLQHCLLQSSLEVIILCGVFEGFYSFLLLPSSSTGFKSFESRYIFTAEACLHGIRNQLWADQSVLIKIKPTETYIFLLIYIYIL